MSDMTVIELPLIEITKHRRGKGDMRVFQFASPSPEQTMMSIPSAELLRQTEYNSNPQQTRSYSTELELDDEIQIVEEITRNSRVPLSIKYERSDSPGNKCITVVSPVRSINNNIPTPSASHRNTKSEISTHSSPKKCSILVPRQIVYENSVLSVNANTKSHESMLENAGSVFQSSSSSALNAASITENSKSMNLIEVANSNLVSSVPPSVLPSLKSSSTNEQEINPFDAEIFAGALLKKSIIRKMQNTGIHNLFEFQCKIIEGVLTGRDIFCMGSEGVGKTIALVLTILQKIDPRISSPQVFYVTSSSEKAQSVRSCLEFCFFIL